MGKINDNGKTNPFDYSGSSEAKNKDIGTRKGLNFHPNHVLFQSFNSLIKANSVLDLKLIKIEEIKKNIPFAKALLSHRKFDTILKNFIKNIDKFIENNNAYKGSGLLLGEEFSDEIRNLTNRVESLCKKEIISENEFTDFIGDVHKIQTEYFSQIVKKFEKLLSMEFEGSQKSQLERLSDHKDELAQILQGISKDGVFDPSFEGEYGKDIERDAIQVAEKTLSDPKLVAIFEGIQAENTYGADHGIENLGTSWTAKIGKLLSSYTILHALDRGKLRVEKGQYKKYNEIEKFLSGLSIGTASALLSVVISVVVFRYLSGAQVNFALERLLENPDLFKKIYSSVIRAPIVEEIMYRFMRQGSFKVLQDSIRNLLSKEDMQDNAVVKWFLGPSSRILIVNTLFALAHMGNVQTLGFPGTIMQISRIFFQPVQSILYETTGGLGAPIGSHIGNNLVAVICGFLLEIT